jgi:hypothetical protein
MITARVTIKEIPSKHGEWAIVTAARQYQSGKNNRARKSFLMILIIITHGYVINGPTSFVW